MTTFNSEAVQGVHDKCMDIFKEAHLSVGEILVAAGNIHRSLGLAIQGRSANPPDQKEMELEYYKNPTPGLALTLEGLEVISWYSMWEKGQIKQIDKKEESTKDKLTAGHSDS